MKNDNKNRKHDSLPTVDVFSVCVCVCLSFTLICLTPFVLLSK